LCITSCSAVPAVIITLDLSFSQVSPNITRPKLPGIRICHGTRLKPHPVATKQSLNSLNNAIEPQVPITYNKSRQFGHKLLSGNLAQTKLERGKPRPSYYTLAVAMAESVDSLLQPCQRMELVVRVNYKPLITSPPRSSFVLGFVQ
jgi:hypothetical protein